MAVMNSSEDRTGIWKRWLEVLLASMFLIGVTVGFLVVGARGEFSLLVVSLYLDERPGCLAYYLD